MNKSKNKLNALSVDLIERIKSIANKGISFAQGEVLFKEGDHKEYIYLIEKGEVALVKDKQEKKIEIMSQNDGEIVGVDLIFNDHDCEYSALVLQPSIVYKVLISDFKELLSNNNGLSLEILKYLSSLINKLESRKLA
ncbi:MAG: cyclic nucleotide-binding domain-containing protein [Flavobacteriales bacterium]|nr:cyclic nucleotide-binding domain-containing protein [Flavobacteriales bacterium]MCB9172982.1 cyclic nucleotide-binding domain-containing protein [Flavobacteriales bacterium]